MICGFSVPFTFVVISLLYKFTGNIAFYKNAGYFYGYSNVLVYLASISFFIMFLDMDIKNTFFVKVINFFAPAVFGVYLIHDNRFLRPVMWNFISPENHLENAFGILFMVGVILAVFIICSLIGRSRQLLFKPLFNSKKFNNVCQKTESFIPVAVNKLNKATDRFLN